MIRIVNLMKKYGENVILKDISLSITPGEAVSIIGPSGSGKSTLLRCINGLEVISGGHIYIDDMDIADPNLNIDKLRERVGMVFQSFNLFPHLTVLENITLPIELDGNEIPYDFINEILHVLKLEDKKNIYHQFDKYQKNYFNI